MVFAKNRWIVRFYFKVYRNSDVDRHFAAIITIRILGSLH